MHYQETNPLVSINIITHNRAFELINALNSVIKQTYTNYEIILIDDGSTDSTFSKIEKYLKQINYVKLGKMGKVYCRNYALNISKGSYVAFLDSDDTWNKDYLEKSVDIMLNNNLQILFNSCNLRSYKLKNDNIYIYNYNELRKLIIRRCPTPTSGMIIKKENFKCFQFEGIYNINEEWHLQIALIINNYIKGAFNPEIIWKKEEDNNIAFKINSLGYIKGRYLGYYDLYKRLSGSLDLLEKIIFKCKVLIFKIHVLKKQIEYIWL